MVKQFRSTDIANTARGIIHNKFVLYFVFAVAILNLFFSAVNQDYLFCVFFVLIGFVAAFFNKNMTVILVCTVAISNILRSLIRGESKFEGMTEEIEGLKNKTDTNESESEPEPEPVVDAKTTTKKKMITTLQNQAQDLLEAQEKIMDGFNTIEPSMTRAESLIQEINTTAKKIQSLQGIAAA